MPRIILLSLGFLMMTNTLVLDAQTSEAAFDSIVAELQPHVPGFTVLVARDGEVIYRKAFGKANLELDVPMAPEHIFRIGSITKQFTACAVLKLAEEGKLSLQDEITDFLPDYPTHGHTITVEHLLTHTSGIKSYTGMSTWDAALRRKDFTVTEMIDFFKDEPIDFEPGERWQYNNSAYFLLGHIIEQAGGQSYADYLQEQFFLPLGMSHTSYGDPVRLTPGRVPGYQGGARGFRNAAYLSMTQPYAAGSLLSNVDDLFTWYEAVMTDRVISADSRAAAHSPYRLRNGDATHYGYGWFLGQIQGSPMIEHGGGINGFVTASLYLPEEKIFVTILTNCDCYSPQQVAFRLAAQALGRPYAFTAIEMAPADLQAYEAVYQGPNEERRIISLEDGQLYSLRTAGDRSAIQAYATDRFFFEGSLTTLRFERDAAGTIAAVVSEGPTETTRWERTELPLPHQKKIALSAEELERFVGTYHLFPELDVVIQREGDHLLATPTNQSPLPIYPSAPDTFFGIETDLEMTFQFDEHGEVTGFILRQGGEYQAKKAE